MAIRWRLQAADFRGRSIRAGGGGLRGRSPFDPLLSWGFRRTSMALAHELNENSPAALDELGRALKSTQEFWSPRCPRSS